MQQHPKDTIARQYKGVLDVIAFTWRYVFISTYQRENVTQKGSQSIYSLTYIKRSQCSNEHRIMTIDLLHTRLHSLVITSSINFVDACVFTFRWYSQVNQTRSCECADLLRCCCSSQRGRRSRVLPRHRAEHIEGHAECSDHIVLLRKIEDTIRICVMKPYCHYLHI